MLALLAASALLLLTTACASSFRCHQPLPTDDPTRLRWDCPKVAKPVLAGPANTSISNQANGSVSVLFSKMNIDLQQQTTALNGSVTAFLEFPITTSISQPAAVRCIVGGFVSKSERASVSVFVDVGGNSALLEFPAGTAVEEKITREISVSVPAVQPQVWPLTVVMTATRPDTMSIVNAQLEEVDCALAAPGS